MDKMPVAPEQRSKVQRDDICFRGIRERRSGEQGGKKRMPITGMPERLKLEEFDQNGHRAAFAQDVRAGLTAVPKRLPCRYFYDAQGSQLFEEICQLPEYYLTRAER